MSAMQMANNGLLQPVSTSASLLQPVGSGLNLSHMSPMQACQLGSQNSACALASSSSTSAYGALGGAASQGHGSLPSCGYMQANQAYPAHLQGTMSVMNMAASSHSPYL